MRRKRVEWDVAIAEIAARQHGLISLGQLRMLGLSDAAIRHRVARGLLHRVYRGIFAVGHPGLSQKGEWKAATMACGEGAVLSHRSAAELWRILEAGGGNIHVTVLTAGGRAPRDGITVHRIPSLPRPMITSLDNIPVTHPQRTLTDLKPVLQPGELRLAVRQAEIRRLPVDAAALIPDAASSPLELAFLKLCRRHRLPTPDVNVPVGPYRVDFLWRRERLIVETDGARYHRGLVSSADDVERDRYLIGLGFEVVRFTYRDVTETPTEVAARVRALLNARGRE